MSLSKKYLLIIVSYLLLCGQTFAEPQSSPSQFSIRVSKDDVGDIADNLIINDSFEKISSDNLLQNLSNLKFKNFLSNDILSFEQFKKKTQSPAILTSSLDEISEEFKLPSIYNVSLTSSSNRISAEKVALSQKKNIISQPVVLLKDDEETAEDFNKTIAEVRSEIKFQDYTRAEILLNQTADKYRNNGWRLAEIASLYDTINNGVKAENIYDKAVAINPKRIELLYSYAQCLYKNGRLDKAEKVLNDLIKINPQFTLAYYNLGNILYKKGKYPEALAAYKETVRLNPLCADAFYNMSMVLKAMNQNTLAQKYYNISTKLTAADAKTGKASKRVSMLFR